MNNRITTTECIEELRRDAHQILQSCFSHDGEWIGAKRIPKWSCGWDSQDKPATAEDVCRELLYMVSAGTEGEQCGIMRYFANSKALASERQEVRNGYVGD